MPAPQRTSLAAIRRAAAELLEADGPGGLTMQAVAERVGVRAPSLYKHVPGRDALVRLVAEDAATELGVALEAAAPPGTTPRDGLEAAASALRRFAHARPAAFRLVLSPGAEGTRPDPEVSRRAAATVLRLAAELAGPQQALPAARTITAWASGFVAMELADAFRMGGDVDAAFTFGVDALARALAQPSQT
ncbi:TetR/AcrR family transcriptional regulator [Actinotalea sp. Marseille-Q4924]|uniref:TetR/AcrR family transcriptional regulator n=1 Tax=Actinotalea sp. Marseille-Q4924 TaxID=2866571 RepID=UPI001CE401B7|nr:TetR/AcrR family transcriptional regulator [Actinotalea sp. Marseille-Q4924]